MLRMLPRPRGRRRSGRARWLAGATATLALVAGGLAVAAPAQAEPLPIVDGFENFEGPPSARWTVSEVPGLTNVAMGSGLGVPFAGQNVALLNAYPDAPATATIFRTITPDSTPVSVTGHLYLQRVAHPGEREDTVILFLRIRAGGPTGRIISVNNIAVTATGPFGYDRHAFNPASVTGRFTVEISAYRGTVRVDDVNIGLA